MKFGDIQNQANRLPFRPFKIGTAGGLSLSVERKTDVLFPASRPDLVIVFDPEGSMTVLDLDSIEMLKIP